MIQSIICVHCGNPDDHMLIDDSGIRCQACSQEDPVQLEVATTSNRLTIVSEIISELRGTLSTLQPDLSTNQRLTLSGIDRLLLNAENHTNNLKRQIAPRPRS